MTTPNRVRTTSTTTGTGNYAFTGSPFAGKLAIGETCFLAVTDLLSAQWENTIGTLQADGTVARTLVEESSNIDNSPINWTAGTRKIVATMGVSGATIGVGVNTAPVTLVDANLIAVDASLSKVFRLTLAGDRTLGNPINMLPGASFHVFIYQDTTGNRHLDYATLWKFPGGVNPVLSTAVNSLDLLFAMYDGVNLVGKLVDKGFS